ncbi:MAG: hypothetical protein U0W40_10270 [Acidimicrobiia bacterium]
MRRAGDEQRRHDLLVEHARVVAHVAGELQAHLEEAQQEAPGDPAADDGELGLVLERGQQHGQRLEEVVGERGHARRAEVADTAIGEPEVGARLGEQAVTVERQLRDLADRQDVAAVDRLHPLGARRALPRHQKPPALDGGFLIRSRPVATSPRGWA